jgi:MinD-like ATPase involved in chromosome partitioning or flagellar assembly
MNSAPPEEPDDGAPPPNPWRNTPPAPPFPAPHPPAPGQPPYGFAPDFAHQPPPFPGAASPPGGEFPGPPFQGPPPEAPGFEPGHGPGAPTEAYDFGPMQPGGPPPYGPPEEGGPSADRPREGETTQYVEQAPPPGRMGGDTPPPPGAPRAGDAGGPRYSRFNQRFDPTPGEYGSPSVEYGRPPGEYGPPPVEYGRQPVEYGPPPGPPPVAYAGAPPQTADSLSTDMLLRGRPDVPAGGWRRVVYKASGGVIHPGESATELRRRELLAHARTPVTGGHYRVAVMSLKGGVGKTTTTVGLGAMLASVRGDRVIALDANPDRGTLSDKVRLETAATVRDLVNEYQQIQRYADVRAFTSQAPSRLEVLASDRDPAASEAFSEEDYRTVSRVLENFYSICITDCGTGLLHSAMAGVLGLADQLILVSSPSVDGARSASATLDWLEAHQYGELVRGGVVVLSMIRPRSRSTVDIDRLQAHFESRCRAVVRVPYDAHLEEGAEVDLEQLAPATQDAYLTLAATVADAFAWQ